MANSRFSSFLEKKKKKTSNLFASFICWIFFFFFICWIFFFFFLWLLLSVEGKRRHQLRLSPNPLQNGFSDAPGREGVGSPGCARSK